MGTRLGKYELGQELGRGGFGTIHIARDHELGRDVAIKLLRREHAFKEHVVQRFLQEARAAARISHPGIVTVFESGIAPGGDVYMAMELLAGETLAQRLKRAGRLAPGVAIELARQMASALAAAHDAGIIHRDLKPANVFLVRDPVVPTGERVKILDFGIAKLVDDLGSNMQTHSMVMLGTPMYMSPEQCKSSAKVDTRSDIYALGCMLFEMVCGSAPFVGDSGELIAKHQLVPPPAVRDLAPHAPEPLALLIAAMLAKSPNDRPPTMHAVVDTLDAILSEPDGPPATTIAGQSEPASPARRRRTLVLAGAGAAIVFGVVTGVVASRHHSSPATIDAAQVAIASDAVPTPTVVPPPPPVIDAAAPVVVAADAAETGCDADALADKGTAAMEKGQHAAALAAFEDALLCKPDDPELSAFAFMASCQLASLPSARTYYPKVPANQRTALVPICVRNGIKKEQLEPKVSCSKQAEDKGVAAEGAGQHAAALASYETAMRCKDANLSRLHKLAFMAACEVKSLDKARTYWRTLDEGSRGALVQMCMRSGIQQADLDGEKACDPKEFEDKGVAAEGAGQHERALAAYEAALKCPHANIARLDKLAFMAACELRLVDKARAYWHKLGPAEQRTLQQMCMRQGITPEDLDR